MPVALVIMDGWGLAPSGPGNAIAAAHTPILDELFATAPHARLKASGRSVGLPDGQMGNSEVGHLTIGAGRVVLQELSRIDAAIEDGTFFCNEVLAAAMDAAARGSGSVHLMGLLSDGGVHSHRDHLYALVRMAATRGARDVVVHGFLDGRDTSPTSGAGFVADLEEVLRREGVGRVGTLMGRYYAMDRDNRWDRVEKVWRALVFGEGAREGLPRDAVVRSYGAGVTDEFVAPIVVDHPGRASQVRDGDTVIFFNFRPDRARELTRAFVDPEFDGFARRHVPDVRFVCLTEYDPMISAFVAFPKHVPSSVLAEVLAQHGLRQLRIAETEKYAHVTYFLSGGREEPVSGEERVLVPSPAVLTYDMKPEMSAPEVTRLLVSAIESDTADVYIVNYANCDMVGHTGVFDAAVKAVEAVDSGVGRVVDAIRARGGVVLVTADHGNAERMTTEDGEPMTAHTVSDVPLIVVGRDAVVDVMSGELSDLAPTLCDLLGIPLPDEWTGRSLLVY